MNKTAKEMFEKEGWKQTEFKIWNNYPRYFNACFEREDGSYKETIYWHPIEQSFNCRANYNNGKDEPISLDYNTLKAMITLIEEVQKMEVENE